MDQGHTCISDRYWNHHDIIMELCEFFPVIHISLLLQSVSTFCLHVGSRRPQRGGTHGHDNLKRYHIVNSTSFLLRNRTSMILHTGLMFLGGLSWKLVKTEFRFALVEPARTHKVRRLPLSVSVSLSLSLFLSSYIYIYIYIYIYMHCSLLHYSLPQQLKNQILKSWQSVLTISIRGIRR